MTLDYAMAAILRYFIEFGGFGANYITVIEVSHMGAAGFFPGVGEFRLSGEKFHSGLK